MPSYAAIDVGTNSVKFHLAERLGDGTWRRIIDRAEVTRLGEGLRETGAIAPAAIERTVAAIAGMVDEAKLNDAAAIVAVGTMGMRSATNSDAFISLVRERTGTTIEVVAGPEEGRLAYLAVKASLGLGDGSLVVFDTGGGSTQFTFGHDGEVDEQFSLDIGAVRLTDQYGLGSAIGRDKLQLALDAIGREFSRLDGVPSPDSLVGMGGAITNMTAVMHGMKTYDPDAIQGSVLSLAEVERQVELYRSRDVEGRRQITGLQPKRADVILAGACVVRTVMRKLGRDALLVSDRGLRHGLLFDRFG